jgi:hypothetical protein
MATRVEGFPTFLLRWLMAPVAFGALLATVAAVLHHRARQPSLPRMSEEWLRNHDIDAGRDYPW